MRSLTMASCRPASGAFCDLVSSACELQCGWNRPQRLTVGTEWKTEVLFSPSIIRRRPAENFSVAKPFCPGCNFNCCKDDSALPSLRSRCACFSNSNRQKSVQEKHTDVCEPKNAPSLPIRQFKFQLDREAHGEPLKQRDWQPFSRN